MFNCSFSAEVVGLESFLFILTELKGGVCYGKKGKRNSKG